MSPQDELFITEKFGLNPGWDHYGRLLKSLGMIEKRHNPHYEEEMRVWLQGSWAPDDIDRIMDMSDEDAAQLDRAFR